LNTCEHLREPDAEVNASGMFLIHAAAADVLAALMLTLLGYVDLTQIIKGRLLRTQWI